MQREGGSWWWCGWGGGGGGSTQSMSSRCLPKDIPLTSYSRGRVLALADHAAKEARLAKTCKVVKGGGKRGRVCAAATCLQLLLVLPGCAVHALQHLPLLVAAPVSACRQGEGQHQHTFCHRVLHALPRLARHAARPLGAIAEIHGSLIWHANWRRCHPCTCKEPGPLLRPTRRPPPPQAQPANASHP